MKEQNINNSRDFNIELPQKKSYDFLLERNEKYMGNVALTFENKVITFEEMHTRIDEYAKVLYKRGIRENDRIAVCLVNTPESVYLLYALNKIGATVIGLSPLNNEYKMRRDIEMFNPKMIITVDMMYSKLKNPCNALNITPILYSPLESSDNKIIKCVYSVKQMIDGNILFGSQNNLGKILKKSVSDVELPNIEYNPSSVTDIMFTGGSTGTHKGVLLNDNGINCVVKALDDVLELKPGMKHLGNIPFGHMAFGRLVMHYALCSNLEFALTLNMLPDKFLDELIRTGVDGAMGGPVHWNTLINNPKIKKGILQNLKQALSGGEMYIKEQRLAAERELRKAGCMVGIGDGLGLTETWAPINVCVSGKNTPGTVGHPIPYVKEKVVDVDTFEELGYNEPGLLLVNCPGMMLGYSDEEETKKVFVYDESGEKWYNTGDIVVMLETGEIKFAGRKKRNFVSGVDNIYPEQIETLISGFSEIKQIVVTKIPDEIEQNLPKYHIVLNSEECNIQELENKIYSLIGSTLGESAAPGYIEYHNDLLPRTDNGKLNASLLEIEDLKNIEKQKILRKRR